MLIPTESHAWPLQFGLSLSALLLTEEKPQSTDNPEREQVLHWPLHTTPEVILSWSTGEKNLGQLEPAPVTTTMSLGSAEDLPLERYWVYCYCSSWIFRGPVKKPESRSSHLIIPKAVYRHLLYKQTGRVKIISNLSCLLHPSTKNAQISTP